MTLRTHKHARSPDRQVFLAGALYDSVEDTNIRNVIQMLEKDADPNVVIPQLGISAFHFITGSESLAFAEEVTKLFLQHGGDPNVQSDDGMTPVHIAAAWGRTSLLQLLLLNGGDPWLVDERNMNAFHYAVEEKHWDAMHLLQGFSLMGVSQLEANRDDPQYHLEKIIVSSKNVCMVYKVQTDLKERRSTTTQTSIRESSPVKSLEKSTQLPHKLLGNLKREQSCSSVKESAIQSNVEQAKDCISKFTEVHNREKICNITRRKNRNLDIVKKDETFISSFGDISGLSVEEGRNDWDSAGSKCDISGIEPLQDTVSVYYNDTHLNEWITRGMYFAHANSSSSYHTCDDFPDKLPGDQLILLQPTNTKPCKMLPHGNKIRNNVIGGSSHANVREDVQSGNRMKGKAELAQPCLTDTESTDSRKTVLSISEEYKYTDKEEGIVLLERRLLVTPVSVSDVESSIRSDLSVIPNTDAYDTDELRQELKARGYNPGPITRTTKHVYRKQLLHSTPIKDTEKAAYSPELKRTMKEIDWHQFDIPCKKLEEEIVAQFSEPDRRRYWREGALKSSFCYLLLDPRITGNLPLRSTELPPQDTWTTFLASIFYIGKGKRSRPYAHLYDAIRVWNGPSCSDSKKVQCILDIWKTGLGVICLHVFQNIIPVDAYTREAAMIDAIGLGNLCNSQHGNYYGKATTWTAHNKKMLGVYLLHRAFLIFLSEGERQLRPDDIG